MGLGVGVMEQEDCMVTGCGCDGTGRHYGGWVWV